MLFNSLEFFIFFTLVYIAYIFSNHRRQNTLLLLASYLFYAAWDWRFLSLIFISTIIDYFCGLKIKSTANTKDKRKFLFISIAANLSILGIFKYFNFFATNLKIMLASLGVSWGGMSLEIILPVGISFYTFQTMSYTIDIYHGKLKPTKQFFNFALFVAFFPQLVAGPIERARQLLPQILQPRKITLENFYEGCYLIFWGLYLKVFVADNLAKIVDVTFAGQAYDTPQILSAIYAFSFQIFCDFAGYSNIARGLGKCMGFDIMINFRLPYFSTNPSEFWQRWHISLSSWIRDYLYIPLGGNKKGILQILRNLVIVMLLGGLWHGAAWTFIIWGLYHGLLLVIFHLCEPISKKISALKPAAILKPLKIFLFYHLICFGWLIFRAQSWQQIMDMSANLMRGVLTISILDYCIIWKEIFPYIFILLIVQILQYKRNDLMAVYKMNVILKTLFYFICMLSLIIWGVTGAQDFIYFQF